MQRGHRLGTDQGGGTQNLTALKAKWCNRLAWACWSATVCTEPEPNPHATLTTVVIVKAITMMIV